MPGGWSFWLGNVRGFEMEEKTFREELLRHIKDNARTYEDLASILGIASRQVFKYKLDHDSFTRLELRALRSALLLSNEEFLVLMDLEK